VPPTSGGAAAAEPLASERVAASRVSRLATSEQTSRSEHMSRNVAYERRRSGSGAARQRASAREPGVPARNERASEQAQPILSLVVRAVVVLAKESGTGYCPSRKYKIAACCSSTGWMLAAVLMPAGLFTALIAAR
jgi:hypothetical protein